MQSKDEDAIDAIDAIDWESWRPTRPSAGAPRSRLPAAMLAIVILGHGLVACIAWLQDTSRSSAVEVEEALLINFIERPAAQAPTRRRPDRPQRRVANAGHPAPPSRRSSATSLQILASPERSANPLRLRLETDPW